MVGENQSYEIWFNQFIYKTEYESLSGLNQYHDLGGNSSYQCSTSASFIVYVIDEDWAIEKKNVYEALILSVKSFSLSKLWKFSVLKKGKNCLKKNLKKKCAKPWKILTNTTFWYSKSKILLNFLTSKKS